MKLQFMSTFEQPHRSNFILVYEEGEVKVSGWGQWFWGQVFNRYHWAGRDALDHDVALSQWTAVRNVKYLERSIGLQPVGLGL